jgi:hypothetical protein
MGTVDYFLGMAFQWNRHDDGELSVLLSQSAVVEYTAHRFAIDKLNPVPNMTPYCSGIPIDSLAPPAPDDPELKKEDKMLSSSCRTLSRFLHGFEVEFHALWPLHSGTHVNSPKSAILQYP